MSFLWLEKPVTGSMHQLNFDAASVESMPAMNSKRLLCVEIGIEQRGGVRVWRLAEELQQWGTR